MSTRNFDAIHEFIAGAADRSFPDDVLDAARQCLVDWFGVCIASLGDVGPAVVRDQMLAWGSRGNALSLYGDRGTAALVALVNGTLAHSQEYDDLHLGTAYHASGPTAAAALALGMDRGCSERDILSAFVVGFEVGVAAGGQELGVNLAHNGWHPTGVLGHYSAVAAAAALLRLDRTQAANAFGLTSTQVAGLMVSAGSMAKPFHVGKAAMNGIVAAELAERGLDGPTVSLDDESIGLFPSLMQQKLELDFSALGKTWELLRNSFKPYPACQLTHAPFDAARKLHDALDGKRIRAVRAIVNPLAFKNANKKNPRVPLEGKFSTAYCVALGLTGHGALPADFEQPRLADGNLRSLAERVEVVPAESMERWAAQVQVTREDGALLDSGIEFALGSLERPMGWPELETKFRQLVEPAYGRDAQRLLTALRSFGSQGHLAEIADIVTGARR